MNTKKVISSAALAASLTFAAGATFAWGCGAGPMMGYGPGCPAGTPGADVSGRPPGRESGLPVRSQRNDASGTSLLVLRSAAGCSGP